MNPAINLEGLQGIEGLRNAPPDPGPGPGPVAPMQILEDAVMPLERTHDELPDYDDMQLHDYSPQSANPQDAPMIDHLQRQEIAHTQHLDNIARVMNHAARANISASNDRSAARSSARSAARYANFKGRVHPGGSKSKRKKRRTTRRKKTRKHTRK